MILSSDYHTHTVFSHGKGTILENAKVAKDKGLTEIAITDHGYAHHAFGIKQKEIPLMKKLCKEATKETGVNVLLGVESNILGLSGKTDMKEKDYEHMDIYLAGIHKFILYDKFKEWFKLYGANLWSRKITHKPSKELIKRDTQIYINAIKNNPIDILAHPCYCFFADAVEVAKCCRDYGTLFEIDARKVHLSDEEWLKVASTGVNFVIDSDAHTPSDVGSLKVAKEMIERTNFPKDKILNIDGKTPKNLRFSEFKKHM